MIVLHVDMDAFFASVEIRDDPALRGKPLIIGSLPGERGVVATCSYEARKYGVRSAMNIKDAYRLCPHGIYRHPNIEKYQIVSRQLHDLWTCYASVIEPVALDEAYLDITEQAQDFEGARKIAQALKSRTQIEFGLTCSVGVAYSKTAAKMASEEKKPNGYFEILAPEEFIQLIIDRDIQTLYTVGPKTAEKLYACGIRTVRDVQDQREKVVHLLGKHGQEIVHLAFGQDDRPVISHQVQDAKSIGREITFQTDVSDENFLKDVLVLLAFCVERRAKRYGLYGKGVTLKITYADMKKITRARKNLAIFSAVTLWQESVYLLNKIEKRPIRLIGLSLYDLSCRTQSLFQRRTLFPEFQEVSRMSERLERSARSLSQENQESLKSSKRAEAQKSPIFLGNARHQKTGAKKGAKTGESGETGETGAKAGGKAGDKTREKTGAKAREEATGEMDLLEYLAKQYGLDFAGHLEKLDQGETFYKTVEYMRKHQRP